MKFKAQQVYTPDDTGSDRTRKAVTFEQHDLSVVPLCHAAMKAFGWQGTGMVDDNDILSDNDEYNENWDDEDQVVVCMIFTNSGEYEITIEKDS